MWKRDLLRRCRLLCHGLTQSRSFSSVSARPLSQSPPLDGEPKGPSMVTSEVPGPKSLQKMQQLSALTEERAVHFFVDYSASKGNYIVDADGNNFLDVYCQIASLPLGYNHPAMAKAMVDPANLPLLMHRPALGNLPPIDWVERVQKTFMSVAPQGLTQINTMMCGSCANENAFKAAFMWYQQKQRGGSPTAEDLSSCMTNSAPGSPNLSVMGFRKGFHGRLLGCLAVTSSKPIHKVDIPTFDWPIVDFPDLKYPLVEYEAENAAEESRCLDLADRAFEAAKGKAPVAAVIIEPIQSEGGDNHASPAFFRSLRRLAAKHGAAFIVDEVQTGMCATGTFWAHEQWGLTGNDVPDIVTFSKKMQAAGFYCKPEFKPDSSYRIFNTWMGDPAKMILLEAILDTVEKDKLLDNVNVTGKYLAENLDRLAKKYPHVISKTRGTGTFLAADGASAAVRDSIVNGLKKRGIEIGPCGEKSFRLRPALVFQPEHAEIFLDALEGVLKEHCNNDE